MLIFSNKSGQLGNRLFAFGHLIAFSAANNVPIVNLSFDEYAKYFECTDKDIFCRYPGKKSWIRPNWLRSLLFMVNKAVLKILRTLKFRDSPLHTIVVADLPEYQFNEDRYFDLASLEAKKKFVFLYGRFFRDYNNLMKHQDQIKKYFTPVVAHQMKINVFMTRLRNENPDLIIGVHIRGGDYRDFVGGKYFYTQADYAKAMHALQQSIPEKKVKFVVCSNDSLDVKNFEAVDVVVGPNHIVEDMYILSECDLIMGPPSTYSLWASFYGNKPLYQIRDIAKRPEISDFVFLPPSILYNFSFN